MPKCDFNKVVLHTSGWLLLMQIRKKLVKHNYNKVSRNNNIPQIPSVDWFKEIVPASKKNHCL